MFLDCWLRCVLWMRCHCNVNKHFRTLVSQSGSLWVREEHTKTGRRHGRLQLSFASLLATHWQHAHICCHHTDTCCSKLVRPFEESKIDSTNMEEGIQWERLQERKISIFTDISFRGLLQTTVWVWCSKSSRDNQTKLLRWLWCS